MLRWFEQSQVYHPSRTLMATGAELNRPFENVIFETSDGLKLNGWFFRADEDTCVFSPTVLVCHGNGGNISHRLGLCETLLDLGLSAFIFDYRGYGLSQGRPSEQGTYEDAQAAVRWLRAQSVKEIAFYGESLGGGIASELCLREKSVGLILQSTFTSIPDIGAELFPWLPVRWLARIRYDTLQKLPQITVPVLVLHSRADKLIPFHHGQRNFAAANQPKLFCELDGGHNDPVSQSAGFKAALENFFRLVKPREGSAEGGPLLGSRS